MKVPALRVSFTDQDRKEILERIDQCLASGMVAQGRNVEELESAFATYTGAKHAIAVNSGTSSIEIFMRIHQVAGKDVLVPTNTFMATAASVMLAGGRARLVDTDARTFSINLDAIRKARTKETVGLVVVHIGGIVTPELPQIRHWCGENGLWLFEDAAHAHGSQLNGRHAGLFGAAGSYSFFSTKVMTCGEGGMLVTDDDALAARMRLMRNHGKPEPWVSYHTEFGSNWRMNELAAAVAVVQLRRLDEMIAWREKIASLYTDLLRDTPELTLVLPASRSSWYKYIVLLPRGADREQVKAGLKERGVSLSGGVYDMPLHQQPVMKGISEGDFPVADDVCLRHICLPLYYGLQPEEARFVVSSLKEVLQLTRPAAGAAQTRA